jgi:hypothetical protein
MQRAPSSRPWQESSEPICSGTISASPDARPSKCASTSSRAWPSASIRTLKAGDVLFIPAGTIHAAKNVGSVTASELATYVVEKGKPLLTLVK